MTLTTQAAGEPTGYKLVPLELPKETARAMYKEFGYPGGDGRHWQRYWPKLLERLPVSTAPTTGSAPVAYRFRHSETEKWYYDATPRNLWECEPLYAAPASPAASVLTDEQISAIVDEFDACHWVDGECRIEGRDMMKLCRALLAASMGGDRT